MNLRIDMAVSSTECNLNSIFDLTRGRLPCSETDEWDLVPGIKGCGFPVIWSVKLQLRQWDLVITHLVHSVIVAYFLAVEEQLVGN